MKRKHTHHEHEAGKEKRVYICPIRINEYSSTYRHSTSTEIEEALAIAERHKKMRAEIEALQKTIADEQAQCQHLVCYDEGGIPYDTRICVICGVLYLL